MDLIVVVKLWFQEGCRKLNMYILMPSAIIETEKINKTV